MGAKRAKGCDEVRPTLRAFSRTAPEMDGRWPRQRSIQIEAAGADFTGIEAAGADFIGIEAASTHSDSR
jgi:hypothetical protein